MLLGVETPFNIAWHWYVTECSLSKAALWLIFSLPCLLVVFRPHLSPTTAEYPFSTHSTQVIHAGWVGEFLVEHVVLTLDAQQHLSLAVMKLVWSRAGTEPDRWRDPEGQEGSRRAANTRHVWSAEIPRDKAGAASGSQTRCGVLTVVGL